MDVTIVVPTYNRIETLRRTVASLRDQDYPADRYEIVVSDDGSADGTAAWLRTAPAESPRLRWTTHPNAGPARTRNDGVRHAEGDIVLFIDDDVTAGRGLVSAHVRAHAAAGGPVAVLGQTPIPESAAGTRLMRHHRARWDRIFADLARLRLARESVPYFYCCSLNLSIRRADLERVGLFDERFTRADFEDTELGYRLVQAGIPLLFCPEAIGEHHFTTDLRASCRRNEANGFQAGTLYAAFTHLKERFRIDHATFQSGSIRDTARRAMFNAYMIRFAEFVVGFSSKVLPEPIACRMFHVLELNYYSLGVRRGLASAAATRRLDPPRGPA